MSHTKFPEVVLHDDDGDGDLAAGAPMLVEALQLVESAQMFSAALRIAHHAEQLSAFLDTQRGANSSPSYTAMRAEAELKEQTQRHRNLLDSVRASFSTLQSTQHVSERNSGGANKSKEMELLRSSVMATYQMNRRKEVNSKKGVDMHHVFPQFS